MAHLDATIMIPMTTKYILTASIVVSSIIFAGCSTVGQSKDIDPVTGKIKTQSIYGEVTATVVKSDRVELAKYKPLILALGGDFMKEQTAKIGYFETVVDREGMEKLLIKEGKSGLVPDVTNLLSWKKISDDYLPFIALKFDKREEGRTSFLQIKAIKADTADEVFVAEVKLDYMWKGVNDDTVFYPLFNAFIEWVNSNK